MKRTEVSIGPAEPPHLDGILEIEHVSFSSPWSRRRFEAYCKDAAALLLVAAAGGAVLGYALLCKAFDEGELYRIAVRPGYRRAAVGSLLLGGLLEWGNAAGLRKIHLEVRAGNRSAIGLYARMAFQVVGRRTGYYSDPKEDALLMTHYLREDKSDDPIIH